MWDLNTKAYSKRLSKIKPYLKNTKFIDSKDILKVLSHIIQSGDRVCIEGDNQKQANFLAATITQFNPEQVNHLHMIQSAIALPEHLDVFEKKIANRIDFAYSGPQSIRLADMVKIKKLRLGISIRTTNFLHGC